MARRARVLFIDHETRLSGGQQDLLDLVRALDRSRVEPHAALTGPGALEDRLREAGVVVHRWPVADRLRRSSRWELTGRPWLALCRAGNFVAASLRLARIVRRVRPDVLHTNSMKAHLLAIVPALASGVPLVWHVRDILNEGWVRSAFAALGGAIPARIVCLSRAAAAQFDRGRARRKVRVVYNGVDVSRFARARANGWRRSVGLDERDLAVGIVGQIAHWKGQDVFVDAAAELSRRYPCARFVIVGECLYPENEAEYAARLRARAGDLGLDGRLVFAGWADDVAEVMRSLDVVVHASRLPEPFGRVIVEAMAAGRPVVASLAGAAAEIVPRGTGRLVPPGDAAALAGAIEDLLRDDEERRACGEAARVASRRFDISATAEGVLRVYREVAACA